MKILLVEDNAMNRDMLSRRLLKRGYQVVIATDGEEALVKADVDSPDLILMDMSLPKLDGWKATTRLKSMSRTRHIPVIALTAHAMAADRQKAINAGCDEYDTKPIDLDRLIAKIQSLGGTNLAGQG